VSAEAERPAGQVAPPPPDRRAAPRLLLFLLSAIAGCTDAISFLGLGGLFTAHITGNLVVLAAHVVSGEAAQMAEMLSVPVFMLILGLTKLLAGGLEARGFTSLRPLLLLQAVLLAGFLGVGVAGGPHVDPRANVAIAAGMLGVAAMAVQNALTQISLTGAPSTAVMTSNITRFMMDAGELLLARDVEAVAKARGRAAIVSLAIVGFAVGCALGAAFQAAAGLWSLTLPTSLALLALAPYFDANSRRSQ
jgi:uncharacterized membrane protein YoaK (UPF0700 family)